MSGRQAVPSRRDLYDRLTAEVLGPNLAPGTKLPSERQLAERFQLSRPVVREVLSELRERGLVEIHPGRGIFVAQVNSTDAGRLVGALYRRGQATPRDLIEARAMLEVRTATLAARHATPEDIAAVERALTGFDTATGVLERAQADIAFHALIARASHNPVIEIMFGSISGLIYEQMLRSLDDPVVVQQGAPYHHTILDGIKAGDPDRASSGMTAHLMVANGTYGDDLDVTLAELARRKIDKLVGPAIPVDAVVEQALRRFAQDNPWPGEQDFHRDSGSSDDRGPKEPSRH